MTEFDEASTLTQDPAAAQTLPDPEARPWSSYRPGDVVERYRILASLGAGGMGVIYRAHDPQLNREVALKFVRPEEDTPQGRARLLREAKMASRIRHPNVIAVHDAGEANGQLFVVMELLDGPNFREWLRAGERPWGDVLAVMLAAGEGLAAAHAHGVIHRDFKP